MSTLNFDGHAHEIEIIDHKGNSLGKWPAFNNIDSGYAKKHYNSFEASGEN